MVRLWIPGEHPIPSANTAYYATNHWSTRHNAARAAKDLVFWEVKAQLGPDVPTFEGPVRVTITQYARNPYDVDAIVKLVLDGLRHTPLIKDDNPKRVPTCVLNSWRVTDASEAGVEIIIEEA